MFEVHAGIDNDQVFKRVFGGDSELCRRLIELALGISIASVEFIETQHESKNVKRPGGTYFDVLATTGSGDLIDVEMQATDVPAMPQRARLYSGRLTQEAWTRCIEAGNNKYNYSKMPQVAVIFVCNFDPLEAGLRRYTLRTRCDETSLAAGDGAVTVFLNAGGSGDEIPADLAAFLSYVASGRFLPGGSAFVDDVARRVATVGGDPGVLEGLMDMDEKLYWSEQKGREEGLAEGAELGARMQADGRMDELLDVLADPALLERELKRYGIRHDIAKSDQKPKR